MNMVELYERLTLDERHDLVRAINHVRQNMKEPLIHIGMLPFIDVWEALNATYITHTQSYALHNKIMRIRNKLLEPVDSARWTG